MKPETAIVISLCLGLLAGCNSSNDNNNTGQTQTLPTAVHAIPGDGSGAIVFSLPAAPESGIRFQASCAANQTVHTASSSQSPLILTGLTNGSTYSCQLLVDNNGQLTPQGSPLQLTPAAETTQPAFDGNIILGVPTDTSIQASLYSPDQTGMVWIRLGTTPGLYDQQTTSYQLLADQARVINLTQLQANTRYYYRLYFQDGSTQGVSPEYSFHTARSPGESFTFSIQGDSHPEREGSQFDPRLYRRTLQTALADQPDFYMTIGDDFSVDNIDPALINQPLVRERYTLQRPYLGEIGHSAPLFLVNGNHEQAARYLLDGTPNNIAVWAQNARNSLYAQPESNTFYSANPEVIPYIGLLRNYYAWTWGDALFVVIDPYWGSPACVDDPYGGGPKRSNLWDITHGDEQYQWLKQTLENSHARYKFVFAHHVMGTGRGGIELATRFEWGGLNNNGRTSDFALLRPTWEKPIHQLMVDNHVNIFFQGHDHIWVHQQLDGVTYQSLPEPADPYYTLYNDDAYLTGERFPNTGYTRVRVAPSGVQVDYVRTYLPEDETRLAVSNGQTAFSYTVH